MPASSYKVGKRRKAAEDVCWTLMLMMALGGLDDVPMEWRPLLADSLQSWADIAVDTGVMQSEIRPD